MFTCERCYKNFKSRKTFTSHIRETHSNTVKVKRCDFCQKPFQRTFNLKRHLLAVHKVGLSRGVVISKEAKSREQFREERKPVYVSGAALDLNSFDEERNPDRVVPNVIYEDISSDEDCFNEIHVAPASDASPKNSNTCNSDQAERDRSPEPGPSGVCAMDYQPESPQPASSINSDEHQNAHGGTGRHVSTISIVLEKYTTFKPDGNTEVARRTAVALSDDLAFEDINAQVLINEILQELPFHFGNARRREWNL